MEHKKPSAYKISYTSKHIFSFQGAKMTHDVKHLFERAMKLEQRAKKFYIHLASIFNEEPFGDFFKGMADDEQDHYDRLKEICDTLSKDVLGSDPNKEALREIETVHKYLDKIEGIEISTIKKALEISHQLEQGETNMIFEFLVNNYVSSKDKKTILLSQIRDHQDKLTAFSIDIRRSRFK